MREGARPLPAISEASVRVDIGGGNVVTSMITVDAVEDLALEEGAEVQAIIKSIEAMIAK